MKPYSGDVYSSDFVGPVQWKYFYCGDASARTDFLSPMAQERGIQATTEFLDSHAAGGFNDIYAAHSVGSQGLPTIGVTDNPAAAEYFCAGAGAACVPLPTCSPKTATARTQMHRAPRDPYLGARRAQA
ncbi:protein of unknown function [Ralstonia solanacearum CMR15]|nr:protein of unknown function [Ralstonia solanacearum CMR15]